MGWLFTMGTDKRDIIADLTATETNSNGTKYETVAHATRGNVLWAVQKQTKKDGTVFGPFIVCFLLGKQKDYGWGYKDMDESMGPHYYSCPLSYLDMCAVINEQWRESVRAYHKPFEAKKSIKEGDVIEFSNPLSFTNGMKETRFTAIDPRKWEFQTSTGWLCRLNRRSFEHEFTVHHKV